MNWGSFLGHYCPRDKVAHSPGVYCLSALFNQLQDLSFHNNLHKFTVNLTLEPDMEPNHISLLHHILVFAKYSTLSLFMRHLNLDKALLKNHRKSEQTPAEQVREYGRIYWSNCLVCQP